MTRFFIKVLIFFSAFSFGQVDFIKNNASLWLKNDTINNCTSYNNNCILNQLESDYRIYSNDFSFFIAFKTENNINKDIVSLKYGNKRIKISNKYVTKQNDTITVLDDNRKAKIVSYIHSDATFSKKGKLKIDLLDNQTSNDDILEIIYIPKVISDFSKEKIETYLSLKYGLSLKENQIYRGVKNDTLWNPNSLLNFSKDVTGIGNDFENFYNKKEAFNYNLSGLEISTDSIFYNNNYALWGHNNKSEVIVNSSDLSNENFRIWHFNKKIDSLDNRTFNLKIKQSYLNEVVDSIAYNEKFYMYISNYNTGNDIELYTGNYYEGLIDTNNDFIFNDVILENNSRFIFIKAPDMNLVARNISICDKPERIVFDFDGIDYPIDLTIKNDSFFRSYKVKDKSFYIDDLGTGIYQVEMKNTFGANKTTTIEIKNQNIFDIELSKKWILNEDGLVDVYPNERADNKALQFTWIQENKVLGNSATIQLNKIGFYSLLVTDGKCQEKFDFEVVTSSTNEILLYPNPAKVDSDVFIKIPEMELDIVDLKVNDINGRLIDYLQPEKLDKNLLKLKFKREGVFIITVKTQNLVKTYKVIIY